MNCKAVIREIEELEMSAALPAEANAHLLSCESCRAFSKERAALRLLVGSLEKVSAPPDFDWRLRARLNEAGKEQAAARHFLTRFAPGAQAIAAAACVTLLLVAVVVYRQTQPVPSGATESASITGANMKERESVEGVGKVSMKRVAQDAFAPAVASNDARPSVSNQSPRARSARSARSGSNRTEAQRESVSQQPRIYSNDMASRSAQDVTSEGNGSAATGAAPVFSVRVPSDATTQLRFEDGQGTRRTLSPVNFGGQELIGRRDKARLIPASEKGIW
ncbi:MAG TPA: hypothetical protein VF543_08470 [Pyrinomonadaceae bacterium]|jgi:hypothetical protein